MPNKLIVGYNDFETWCNTYCPSILNEWDYSKNDIKPVEVCKGSHKTFSFICSECGTLFKRQPHQFLKNGSNGCPNCWIRKRAIARKNTAVKKNNFKDNFPNIAKEWSNKNSVSSSDVSYNSNKKYWWKCMRCGYEWEASIANRVRGTGCPKCKSIFHTSFPEQAIFYYIKKEFKDAVNGDKHLGVELDVFVPSINTAIEYDGKVWHRNYAKDEKKNLICQDKQIVLYRVREEKSDRWQENEYLKLIYCKSGDLDALKKTITKILFEIGKIKVDIDLERDRNNILDNYLNSKENNSLSAKYPSLAKEWHPIKNLPLTPDKIDFGSGIRVYWICSKCGNEFEATPNSRTCKKSGCPICTHKIAIYGKNDIETSCESIMLDWDYDKNQKEGLNPRKLLQYSMKEAYWKCHICGCEWKTSISNRTQGKGCPQCVKRNRLKRVKNVDTGEIFNSIKEASEKYNLQSGKISECCRGKRKTTGGFHWEYIKKYD